MPYPYTYELGPQNAFQVPRRAEIRRVERAIRALLEELPPRPALWSGALLQQPNTDRPHLVRRTITSRHKGIDASAVEIVRRRIIGVGVPRGFCPWQHHSRGSVGNLRQRS